MDVNFGYVVIVNISGTVLKMAHKSCVYLQLWFYFDFSLVSMYELFKFICWANAIQLSAVAL
jgi:hypothetical protein